jgi:hypothetical protein
MQIRQAGCKQECMAFDEYSIRGEFMVNSWTKK